MIELRPYQTQAIERTAERIAQGHRPIVCAATGSGKTVIAAQIARTALDSHKRVLWMTGREEIIKQAYRTFSDLCGVEKVGVLCAGLAHEAPWWFYPEVTLASWDTLKARWHKSELWQIPADVVIYDEAHLALSPKMVETVIPHYANAEVIGMTATPARKSGKGLGTHFSRIIQVQSVAQLQDEGYLAHCEYWAGSHADVSRVKTVNGDYEQKGLAAAAVEGKLIGDVIDNWLRLAHDRHTIVFAVDIAHAQALAERFQATGIGASAIHSKMTHGTRAAISEDFRRQRIQVLVNVGITLYGYDAPSVNCVVLGRPTKSIVLHHQMIGRGLRPKPNDDFCMVLDHADNIRRLGCVEDEIRWKLDQGQIAATNTTRDGDESRCKQAESPPTECEECHHIFARSRVCPKCGWEKPVRARDVEVIDGDLVKIRKSRGRAAVQELDPETWYREALGYVRTQGKKDGAAFFAFVDKFGEKPPYSWRFLEPLAPGPRVTNYFLHRNIRYAKRQRKDQQRAHT